MPELSTQYIREIAAITGFPKVTVHTPMDRAGKEVEQNRIRLKNAAAKASQELVRHGMAERDAEVFVAQVRSISEDYDRMQHQIGGMSLFVNAAETRVIELASSLPEVVEVGDRFSIVELLRPALEDRDYAILTLSRGGVGLYRASRYGAELVELSDLPEDLCYVLRYDQFEKSVQLHTSSAGGDATVHHGHGAGKDEHDRFITRFIEAVEPPVTAYVEHHALPLVLIGTEESVGYYRKRTNYRDLVEEERVVDPHTLSLDDLILLGWECMGREVEASRQRQIERFRAHDNTVRGIHAVLPAVAEGRAEAFFIDPESTLRGSFDPMHEEVVLAAQPEDGETNLLNLAATYALEYETQIVLVSAADDMNAPAATLY